jgi:protein involved in temperature-dependent protein secretion
VYHGLGQRVLTTDTGEHAVMDVRQILIGAQAVESGQDSTGA